METAKRKVKRAEVRIRYIFRGDAGMIRCLAENADMIARHLYKDGAIRVKIF